MDESILKVLSFVIGVLPDTCKVNEKMILSDTKVFQPKNNTVIFIVRPDRDVVQQIIHQRDNWKKHDEKEVYILFVPRRTIECDELLHENNLFFNDDRISQINMDLVPLEDDMLSLELPMNFAHHLLQDDDNYKINVQYSLHRLEAVYGRVEHKFGLGKVAKEIIGRVEKNTLNIDQSASTPNADAEIDALIMVDRDVDLISPFCVNQNYEGLLDEFFGIKCCTISVDNKIVYPDDKVRKELGHKDNEKTDFLLTSEDVMFNEIRNKHFNVAGPHLNKQIASIQAMMEDKSQKTIQELDKFIKKLKNMNVVKAKEIATSHINVAFSISQSQRNLDYLQIYSIEGKCIMGEVKEIPRQLEAKMTKQYNKMKILRAMCILSTTQGGLQKAEFDTLRRAFIMNYGYQEIVTLMNLQDAGLFKLKDKKAPGYFDWNWEKIKTAMNLVNEDGVNFMNPSDISYVYNGYSPISVKLVEMILENNGLASLIAKGIPKLLGLTEDRLQVPAQEQKLFAAPQTGGITMGKAPKKKRILVYFLGGITFAEIAALRFLQNLNPKFKIIIATTSIINGETGIAQLIGPQENNLMLNEILR